jgi:hypothetical protein
MNDETPCQWLPYRLPACLPACLCVLRTPLWRVCVRRLRQYRPCTAMPLQRSVAERVTACRVKVAVGSRQIKQLDSVVYGALRSAVVCVYAGAH